LVEQLLSKRMRIVVHLILSQWIIVFDLESALGYLGVTRGRKFKTRAVDQFYYATGR